jgi:hypothetical protein
VSNAGGWEGFTTEKVCCRKDQVGAFSLNWTNGKARMLPDPVMANGEN